MKHLGDIAKIDGAAVPTVDVVIGGFPYLWEQLNGKGSCIWASEVDDFAIAVTKLRIGGEQNE